MTGSNPARSYCPLCQASYDRPSSGYCSRDGARLQPVAAQGAKWIGRVVNDKYRILRFLGAGATAEVFEAEHLTLGRHVAVKVLHAIFRHDPTMVVRFRQEARLVSLIRHPNVVTVEDAGELEDGTLYMVLELLQGRSLEQALAQGPMDPGFALDVALQTCDALIAAHSKNIVHRDIKPANIYLHSVEREQSQIKVAVKVLDLGIAKLHGDEATSTLTVTGSIFGTPQYMSPEQAVGESVDWRADVYSLGVVVFEMLTGAVPFDGSSFHVVLTKHLTEAPRWPDALTAERGLPPETEAVVLKALAKARDQRYGSMAEMRAALDALRARIQAPAEPAADGSEQLRATHVVSPSPRPSELARVALGSASGADNEVVEIAPDTYWVGRRQGALLECNSYLRVYHGEGATLHVLIDPGPPRDLDVIAAKVSAVIGGLDKIDIIFLNHQDPDVAANAAIIQQLNARAHVVCSEDTWRLAQFYGLRPQSYSAVEHFRELATRLATGHRVSFVPTPHCHFRGAVMYYDHLSRVLFSGDLFGGLSRASGLVASGDDWSDVDIFHELYMPSRRALVHAVDAIRALAPAPALIAPQHGALVPEALVPTLLDRIGQLEVGMDLICSGRDKARYVRAANDLVSGLSALLGRAELAEVLHRFAADGSFPDLFVFSGEHAIADIKIEPRAAVRALWRDVLATVGPRDRDAASALVARTLARHGLRVGPAPEDEDAPASRVADRR